MMDLKPRILNNIESSNTKLIYTCNEDENGTDEGKMKFVKNNDSKIINSNVNYFNTNYIQK